jgi:hypothetical protein
MAAKWGELLFISLILIVSTTSFGGPSPQAGQFSDYINSNEISNTSIINVIIHHETPESPGNADAGPEWQGGIPAAWRACQADRDCTAVAADCATWEPVNKKYLSKFTKYLNSCTSSIDPGFQPQAVCNAKACQTTDKTTGVSWKEWISAMKDQKGS